MIITRDLAKKGKEKGRTPTEDTETQDTSQKRHGEQSPMVSYLNMSVRLSLGDLLRRIQSIEPHVHVKRTKLRKQRHLERDPRREVRTPMFVQLSYAASYEGEASALRDWCGVIRRRSKSPGSLERQFYERASVGSDRPYKHVRRETVAEVLL